MNTRDEKMHIAAGVLAALIERPDSGLFNYDEMADMAWKYAEALQKRSVREMYLQDQQMRDQYMATMLKTIEGWKMPERVTPPLYQVPSAEFFEKYYKKEL